MKVALLARAAFPFHGYGGLERHVAALFKYLRRSGCEVTLFTSPPETVAVPEPESVCFVPYRTLPWPKRRGFVVLDRDTNYLAWSLRAGERAHEGAFDIVQADGGAAFGYAYLAKAVSPPLVLHPHGMEEFKAPPLKRTAYLPLRSATRFAARRAARVVAPDAAMKGEVRRYLGVDDDRIVVVPNAIDLEAIDAMPRAKLDRFGLAPEPEEPILLSVGRLEANKGFDVLARALSEIRALSWKWVLAGEGPMRVPLERAVEEDGLTARVLFAGRVSDAELAALFDRTSLFVHPTLYEGSSLVTLEAMAHGKAVVASRVGGIPDKVLDGENGRLVSAGDSKALLAALRHCLSGEADLGRWGERSRELVEERFDWAKRAGELLALYEALVS